MASQRAFKVHRQGEPPTAAYALWIDLTKEQVATVEAVAHARKADMLVVQLLREIAVNAIEKEIPNIGRIYPIDASNERPDGA